MSTGRERRARGRSVRTQLLLALMLMTLLTLLIASAFSTSMNVRLVRQQMLRDQQVLAAVVGENCISALVFDSPETAERHLATLGREYQVRRAVLYDAESRPFARFEQDPARRRAGRPARDTGPSLLARLLATDVEVAQPLQFDDRPIGRLVLNARLDELEHQVRVYALSVGLLGLATLGTALMVALYLQRRISEPILRLAAKTRALSQRQDLRMRVVEPASFDEIDTLVRGLNVMLATLEERELALRMQSEELDQANAKLRGLATEIALVEERERKRLACELHDSPMQKLAVAQLQIAAVVEPPLQERRPPVDERLYVGLGLIREALAEMRSLQFELSPPPLYLDGLGRALESLAAHTTARFGITIRYAQLGEIPGLRLDLAVVLYQCARELVYNLLKHAGARHGTIRLRSCGGDLALDVEDDGRGFPTPTGTQGARATGGYGLFSIQERLALIGGRLQIASGAQGSCVTIRLPLTALRSGPGERGAVGAASRSARPPTPRSGGG